MCVPWFFAYASDMLFAMSHARFAGETVHTVKCTPINV